MSNWQKLATEKVSSDATYAYYQASSSGLSVFAIVGEIIGAATTTTGPATTTTSPFGLPEAIGGVPMWAIGIVIVVVVVIVVIFVLAKKRVIELPFKLPSRLPSRLPFKLPGGRGTGKETGGVREAGKEASRSFQDLYKKYNCRKVKYRLIPRIL
jgi:hypothetical protein